MLGALSIFFFRIRSGVSSEAARRVICAQVARILREERLAQRLSMTVLSERAGLSQQSISYVERGMRIPNLDTLLRITGALSIDLEDVIARARGRASARAG